MADLNIDPFDTARPNETEGGLNFEDDYKDVEDQMTMKRLTVNLI